MKTVAYFFLCFLILSSCKKNTNEIVTPIVSTPTPPDTMNVNPPDTVDIMTPDDCAVFWEEKIVSKVWSAKNYFGTNASDGCGANDNPCFRLELSVNEDYEYELHYLFYQENDGVFSDSILQVQKGTLDLMDCKNATTSLLQPGVTCPNGFPGVLDGEIMFYPDNLNAYKTDLRYQRSVGFFQITVNLPDTTIFHSFF